MDSNSDLFINWHLLDGLNHDTEYSSAPSRSFYERYPREELLETAYSLLSLNRQQYIFRFYGGEPTIHPHFRELLAYIGTSGRNTRVILDTNGIRSNNYYLDLLKTQGPGRLHVRLSVHCKYMEFQRLSYLIVLIVEKGFSCQVTVNHVPAYEKKAALLFQKLRELRKHIDFSLRMAFPMGGESAWTGEREIRGANMPAWTSFGEGNGTASLVEVIDEPYACVGVNCVQVSADGICTLGLKTNDREFAPAVMEEPVLCDGLPHPPAFPDYNEAAEWLESFKRAQLAREIEGGAIRHPLHGDFDAEQSFRMRLKRLPRGASASCDQYPELWLEHRNELIEASGFFADEASRQVFFGLVRAMCTGDGSSLCDSPYKAFEHPAIDDKLYPFSETATKFCRRLRCTDDFTTEILEDMLPRIAWYRPAAEIVLPDDASWLTCLLAIRRAFAGYDLYLGCHDGQHILYASPNPPRKRIPLPLPRAADGIPLVSFILPVGEDERLLEKTIESILAERLVRYEIVLVLDSDTLLMAVRDYVRREPWCIREYRVNDGLSYWECCDAGVEMAQGEYTVFLRPGCVLEHGVAGMVLKTLKKAECGAVLCGAGKSAIYPRKAAVKGFLSGTIADTGLANTVCKTSLLRSYGIKIARSQSFDATLLLLQLLHPSKKTAVLAYPLVGETDDATRPSDRGRDFILLLRIIVSFYRAHSLSLASPDLVNFIRNTFRSVSPDFLRFLKKKDAESSLDDLLTPDFLAGLSAFPFLAQDMAHKGLRRRRVLDTYTYTPCGRERDYAGIDSGDLKPTLSVCIILGGFSYDAESEREYCTARIRSLAHASLFDFDFVLLDNSGNEQLASDLDDLADIYPSVRVFHTPTYFSEARVRSIGLAKARARYVTFVSRLESVTPDFLTAAQSAVRNADDAAVILPRYPGFSGNGAKGEDVLACLFSAGLPLSLDFMLVDKERVSGTEKTESATETLVWDDEEKSEATAAPASLDMVSEQVFVLSLLAHASAVSFLQEWTPQYGVSRGYRIPGREYDMDADEEISVLEATLAIVTEVLESCSQSDAVVQGIRSLVADLLSRHTDLLRMQVLESGEAPDSHYIARTLLAL